MSECVRLDRDELPWPPLVPRGEGLNRYPARPDGLRARMAQLYGVPPECVLPIMGTGYPVAAVARALGEEVRLLRSPSVPEGTLIGPDRLPDGVTLVDEGAIEFADDPEAATLVTRAASDSRLLVYRGLGAAYGLAGAVCGALVGTPARIGAVEAIAAENPLPTPVVQQAEAVLDPSRMLATQARIATIRAERERLRGALGCPPSQGNWVLVHGAERARFAQFGIAADWLPDGTVRVTIGTPAENDLVLAAMGRPVATRAHGRTAEVARDTKETRIVARVDLDRAAPVRIETGIGYWDHMLEQVAAHGGFSLELAAEGDLHIDPHHTIEDSALALGQALRQALGDRRGIGRYGFTAPMDEAQASVALDLGGRPFARFEGAFAATHIGQYPTQLTPHVFRSLADSLGAAIHVRVEGEDDHHKTEVAFKALGRALAQAIRVEGDAIPSTKGMIA